MWQDRIGSESEPVSNLIEPDAVRRFTDAVGDANPLYDDDAAAADTPHGRPIAPPTFPLALDYGELPDLPRPESGVLRGEQTIRYERPLYVGETVECSMRLADVYEKDGGDGRLTFLVFERRGTDEDGATIFTTRDVAVIGEAVRRALEES